VLIVRYDWRNNSVLFVHNLDEKPREIAFSAGVDGEAGKLLVNLLAEDHSHADDKGRHRLVLEPYGYRWYPSPGSAAWTICSSAATSTSMQAARRDTPA